MTNKTFSEQIADLENTRAAKVARIADVMQKSVSESRTTDAGEAEEVDTLQDEVKAIDADLVRLRGVEALNAKAAKPVAQNPAAPGVAREQLQTLVDAAHIVCPYSNATRGNIDVTLVIAD